MAPLQGFPGLAGLSLRGNPQGPPQQDEDPGLPDGALEGQLSAKDLAYLSDRRRRSRTPGQLPEQLLDQLPHRALKQRKGGSRRLSGQLPGQQPAKQQAPEAPDPTLGQLLGQLPRGFSAVEDGPSAPSMPPSCSCLPP